MTDATVRVTGASGYLGGLIARRYVEAGVPVLVHGRRPADLDEGGSARGGVQQVVGDLTDHEPFAAVGPEWRDRITSVVHAGAITRFDVDRDAAQAVTWRGPRR